MQNEQLYEQFKDLTKDNGDNRDSTQVIPVMGTSHKLGASIEGYPKFFVCTNDAASATADTTLDILSVEYNQPATFINDENVKIPHHYTIITLRSADRTLQEVFFDIAVMMLKRMTAMPSKREIAIEVENMISIFSAMSCAPRKKIQGLWTELLVIERSYMPEILIKAWHESPTAKYDFSMGRDKVEVKSTSGETRIHHFSLDQLSPSVHSRVVVASAIVRETAQSSEGLSVHDLYNRICDRMNSVDAKMRMMKIIAETIGTDIHRLNEVFFDYATASDTLRFFNSRDIPGVDRETIRTGVTQVGFNSDLSGAVDIQSDNSNFVRGDSPLYKSLFP